MKRRAKKQPSDAYHSYLCSGLFVFIAVRVCLPSYPYFAERIPLVYLIALIVALAACVAEHIRLKHSERKKRLKLTGNKAAN